MSERLEARIRELADMGSEDSNGMSQESLGSFLRFCAAFGEPIATFLLDNGNIRARWHLNGLSSNIEFVNTHVMHHNQIKIPQDWLDRKQEDNPL